MPVKNIDAYIRLFPKDVQPVLKKLRQTMKIVSSGALETISYSIPTFKLNGKPLVYFAGFKNHVSVYPAVTPAVSAVKGLAKYKVSKGTLKFPLNEPIPFKLIEKFVRHRVQETLANSKKQKKN